MAMWGSGKNQLLRAASRLYVAAANQCSAPLAVRMAAAGRPDVAMHQVGQGAWKGFSSSSSTHSLLRKLGPGGRVPAVGKAPSSGALGLTNQQVRHKAGSALKAYKPTTPGFRGRIITSRDGLWKGSPVKALTVGLTKSGGRNNQGRITNWKKGGGHKRKYRVIDFKRRNFGQWATVQRIEYDPNRSARLALLQYEDESQGCSAAGESYILAPVGLEAGDRVMSGPGAPVKPGCAMPLVEMPLGTTIHNVEMQVGKGAQMVRSAGAAATLVKKGDDGYVVIKMPSGEQRLILGACMATVGRVGNEAHMNRKLGKAGANRWLGRRPTVRGVAMNPIDHPHGGGEGRTSGGRPSVTPWGYPTKGRKTRNSKRTDNFIRTSRHDLKKRR